MNIVQKIAEVKVLFQKNKKPIVFIPTMGSLHEGHLSLIDKAKQNYPHHLIVTSIFVNPLQFSNSNDFKLYPRKMDKDIKLCKENKVDIVLIPYSEELTAISNSFEIKETKLSNHLCGKSRTGHFSGVCTILMKFFHLVRPEIVILGKKDFQQIRIVEKLIEEFHLSIKIHRSETQREEDGLPFSSRNILLSKEERKEAAIIYQSLRQCKNFFLNHESTSSELIKLMQKNLSNLILGQIDYLEIVDQKNLAPVEKITIPALLAVAVNYRNARLIDNIEIFPLDDGKKN